MARKLLVELGGPLVVSGQTLAADLARVEQAIAALTERDPASAIASRRLAAEAATDA